MLFFMTFLQIFLLPNTPTSFSQKGKKDSRACKRDTERVFKLLKENSFDSEEVAFLLNNSSIYIDIECHRNDSIDHAAWISGL